MMKNLKILIGGVGHPTKPSLVNCLKLNNERLIKVYGMDADANLKKPAFIDKLLTVPMESDPEYINRVLDICKLHKIDVFYSGGEWENILVNKRKLDFEKINTKTITVGDINHAKLLRNKYLWVQRLKNAKLNYPKHFKLSCRSDLKNLTFFAENLGYPNRKIILKPCFGVGGRGVFIISNNQEAKLNDRKPNKVEYSLEEISKLLYLHLPKLPSKNDESSLLLSEFLEGRFYSVDVLSDKGNALYVIPKIKISGNASFTRSGKIDLNFNIIKYIKNVCSVLNLDNLQNYELCLDNKNKPYVFDINPRGGASIDCCRAAGANILYFAVKKVLGEKIPKVKVNANVSFTRYMHEYYQEL